MTCFCKLGGDWQLFADPSVWLRNEEDPIAGHGVGMGLGSAYLSFLLSGPHDTTFT